MFEYRLYVAPEVFGGENKGKVDREEDRVVKKGKRRREVGRWLWRGLGIWMPCFQPSPRRSGLGGAVCERIAIWDNKRHN
jgi:hypothetical protein